jgi:hypothetical protein
MPTAAAERCARCHGYAAAREEAQHEYARHAIARLDSRHAGSQLDYFAHAIAPGDQALGARTAPGTAGEEEAAHAERPGARSS